MTIQITEKIFKFILSIQNGNLICFLNLFQRRFLKNYLQISEI